jgi:hypothetical protein
VYATYSTRVRPATSCTWRSITSLPFGEVEELLRSAGARVVEGPATTGIFGIVPSGSVAPRAAGATVSPQLRALAARLHGDARVRWIEPLPAEDSQGSPPQDH